MSREIKLENCWTEKNLSKNALNWTKIFLCITATCGQNWKMEKAKKAVVTLYWKKIRVKNIFSKKLKVARIKYNFYPHLKIRRFLLGGYTGIKWSIFGWGRKGFRVFRDSNYKFCFTILSWLTIYVLTERFRITCCFSIMFKLISLY